MHTSEQLLSGKESEVISKQELILALLNVILMAFKKWTRGSQKAQVTPTRGIQKFWAGPGRVMGSGVLQCLPRGIKLAI